MPAQPFRLRVAGRELTKGCCEGPCCSGARMPTSANCPKNRSDVRADVGIRAPILPLSQQPLTKCTVGKAHVTLHELYEFQVHSRAESGGVPPHSKTLTRGP